MENLLQNIQQIPKGEFGKLTAGKKLIVFDLDGTLTESKSEMDTEMASLVKQLLETKMVAVIGGGKYELFQKQFISKLDIPQELADKLFLFPTNSTLFYRYIDGSWQKMYAHELTSEEKKIILDAFDQVFTELNYKLPEKIYGKVIEDRETQITFSALGQEAPLDVKKKWNEENKDLRSKIEKIIQKKLPLMEAKITGLTSIDVTRKGIDKKYGIKKISEQTGVPISEMVFVGDAFSPEGNDEAALRSGILCFKVSGVDDTKRLIKYLLNS